MSEANGFAGINELLGHTGRRYTEVVCGGMKFRIRSLTSLEYAEVESETQKAVLACQRGKDARTRNAMAEARSMLLAMCLVDGDGNQLIPKDRRSELNRVDMGVLTELAKACEEHCGLVEEGDEKKPDREEA